MGVIAFGWGGITGTGLTNLIDGGFNNEVALASKDWGAGAVFFGGMTTYLQHYDPSVQHSKNLRKNILEYLRPIAVTSDAGVISVDSPAVVWEGFYDVEVTIANLGPDTINSLTVEWEFNGVAQPLSHTICSFRQ